MTPAEQISPIVMEVLNRRCTRMPSLYLAPGFGPRFRVSNVRIGLISDKVRAALGTEDAIRTLKEEVETLEWELFYDGLGG